LVFLVPLISFVFILNNMREKWGELHNDNLKYLCVVRGLNHEG
jgi:hypothetical protein